MFPKASYFFSLYPKPRLFKFWQKLKKRKSPSNLKFWFFTKLYVRSVNLVNFRTMSSVNYNCCHCLTPMYENWLRSPNDIMSCFEAFASPINHFFHKYILSSFSRIIYSLIFSFLKYKSHITFARSFIEE